VSHSKLTRCFFQSITSTPTKIIRLTAFLNMVSLANATSSSSSMDVVWWSGAYLSPLTGLSVCLIVSACYLDSQLKSRAQKVELSSLFLVLAYLTWSAAGDAEIEPYIASTFKLLSVGL
jgi:hypothetical protein